MLGFGAGRTVTALLTAMLSFYIRGCYNLSGLVSVLFTCSPRACVLFIFLCLMLSLA